MCDLSEVENDKYYNDLVGIVFTDHFKERMYERVEEERVNNFLVELQSFLHKLAEKVFLHTSKEFRVYCKMLKSYIIVRYDGIHKILKFITVFPLNGTSLTTKYTNNRQVLISL